jgi:ornithine carbamoyltransferase/carbamoyltransferase
MAGLLSLDEIDAPRMLALVDRAVELHRDRSAHDSPLAGSVAGMMFLQTSTRTRTAFSSATVRLGGDILTFGPHDLQLSTGESRPDTGRMFSAMLDLLVVRTSGPTTHLRDFSGGGGLPVVNAMSADEHPTQALTDIAVLRGHFGDLTGLKLLYIGEGNNTATALVRAATMVPGCQATFWTPPGYGLPDELVDRCHCRAAEAAGSVRQVSSADELPADVDAVYTTRWQTTGTAKADPSWREVFRPYFIDAALMARWPEARVLHDLPAHRGEEISGEVLDGEHSLAWTQGAMKLATAMAVLEWVAR